MDEIVFLDGRFIPRREAVISVFEPGFLYGFGVFETMRSISGKIAYFDGHFNRLKLSCAMLHITLTYSQGRLKSIINETVRKNNLHDARVRLSVWKQQKDSGVLITASKYEPLSKTKYIQGFRICVADLRQDENSLLSRIKSMNRLFYELCYHQAKNKGFDEALILNSRGYISECSRANIFIVKNKELFTPSLDCGCLGGITRMAVLGLAEKHDIRFYEGHFIISDVKSAEEVFITNSLIGIMPVTYLENNKIGDGTPGALTLFFSQKYFQICNLRR